MTELERQVPDQHAAILVPVMCISIRTLGFFVSIKTISIDIKLIQIKFFCLSNNDHLNSADQLESSGKSVIIAAVLAWNPGQALSRNPRHAQHQREFLSWIPRKAAK